MLRKSLEILCTLTIVLLWAAPPDTCRQATWVTNGSVYDIVESDGKVYIGGNFSCVGPYTGGGVPVDASSGSLPATFPKIYGGINAVCPDGSGGWFVGGFFTNVGGVSRRNIAHILSSGNLDAAWNPGANEGVLTLAVSGSTVYAGGDFDSIGGQKRRGIASLDATSGTVTAWNPNAIKGPSVVNGVLALAVSGSTVYVGGSFDSIGGQPRRRIAALDSASGNATAWNPSANSVVYALTVSGSVVYAGGEFDSIAGQARNRIGALEASSGNATDWNPSANSYVYAIAVSGSMVYVGGRFCSIGCQTRRYIAALDATTGNATSWNPNANAVVSCLAVNGSVVYAAGSFTNIGGQTRHYSAALNTTTGNATSWNPDANASVSCLAVSGSVVYAAGSFRNIGGQTRRRIAALNATTGNATSWNPGADSTVYALAVSGSTIYVGGEFLSIGGQSRSHIAALNSSGNATPWNPSANDYVTALAVSGTTVYAGGGFTYIGGQPRNYIAALTTTSASGYATTWNPNADSAVSILTVGGSTVYAAGNFHGIGGQTRNKIAELEIASGNATNWNPNAGCYIFALALSGTTVYAGGGAGIYWGGSSTIGQGIGHPFFAQFGDFYPAPAVQSITPASGTNNGSVQITNLTGANFRSGASVKLSKTGQADITATNVIVASSAQITCTFDITSAFGGAWNVVVANDDAKTGSLANGFTIVSVPPVLVSPANASVDVSCTPALIWHKASNDSLYSLKLSASSNFDVCIINENKITDTTMAVPAGLLAGSTQYYWKAAITKKGGEVTNFCTAWSFTTAVPPPPAAPALATPANSATDQALNLAFTWNSVSGASTYRLQLSTTQDFSGNVVADDSTLATTTRLVGPLSTSTTYYWRVNAKNAGGTGAWSETRSFTTQPPAAGAPTLSSPANSAANQALSLSLAWNAATGASTYRVQLSTTQDFSGAMVVDDSTLATTTKPVGPLSTGTTYYWRVNAKNAGGTSAWSETWGFATVPAAPAAPVVVSPVNGSADAPLPLRVQWKPSQGASSYRVNVSLVPDFNTVRDTAGIADTVCVIAGLTNNTRYYVRISATNPGGTSAWSAVCSLTTIVALPSAVSLLRPAIGDTVKTDSMLLVWTRASPIVTKYRLDIATDSQFVNATIDSSITDSTKIIKSLSNNATYWWRVRACNAAGWGPWSAPGRCIVAKPITAVIPREYGLAFSGMRAAGGVIKYGLPKQSRVSMRVYDLHGRMLFSVVDRVQPAGIYSVRLSAASCTNGYQILTFKAGDYRVQRKFVMMR